MKLSLPKISTTAGASATAAAGVNVLLGLLNGWHWWSVQPTAWQASVATVLTAAAAYLGAWLKVVMTPGQQTSMELTSSPLPTMQVTEPAPVTVTVTVPAVK